MTPKPGIYPGVPFAEYQSWEAVNPSFLTTLSLYTPYHAKRDQTHPKPETDDKRIGRALHSRILEPATFNEQWLVLPADAPRRPSDRQRNAKTPSASSIESIVFWEEVEASGKEIVKAAEFALIEEMASEIRRKQCVNMICNGQAEVSIVWTDGETGLLCKSRLDYHRYGGKGDWNHYITDLKSSRDIRPERFRQDIARFGYALAAAMRIDAWAALNNGEQSVYNLLAVDKGYCVAWVKDLKDSTILAGRNHYRAALATAAECVAKDEWPDYGDDVGFIGAPDSYLQSHGVGPYNIQPEPVFTGPTYSVDEEPEPDEIDAFLKGDVNQDEH